MGWEVQVSASDNALDHIDLVLGVGLGDGRKEGFVDFRLTIAVG